MYMSSQDPRRILSRALRKPSGTQSQSVGAQEARVLRHGAVYPGCRRCVSVVSGPLDCGVRRLGLRAAQQEACLGYSVYCSLDP